jgi:hypothetical protein
MIIAQMRTLAFDFALRVIGAQRFYRRGLLELVTQSKAASAAVLTWC